MNAMNTDLLDKRTLLLYALPAAGFQTMHWLIMVFLLKFSTDTMGIGPMAVGLIFGAGRFWDALSDPLAGWFSDRTRSRLGRRRPWMLFAAVPLGIGFVALWSAPVGLSTSLASLWLAGSVLLFYTALTSAKIPYLALGAELTANHHERTRLSAYRVAAEAVGIFLAIACLHVMENAASTREMASIVAAAVSLVTIASVVFASLKLREPLADQAQAAEDPIQAIRDVARNPHAMRLTLGLLLAEIGLGALLVSVPFVTELQGRPGTSAVSMLGFIIPFAVAVPIWVRFGRRYGKGRSFAVANGICAVAFVMIGLFAFGEYSIVGLIPLLMVGMSQAAIRTFPDSIKADCIDWDESETGERKEGSYFAVWNLVDKLGGVVSVALVGYLIQGADGQPDPLGIKIAVSYIPAFFMTLAMVALWGYRLDESSHGELRSKIRDSDSRRFAAERSARYPDENERVVARSGDAAVLPIALLDSR